VCVLAQKKKGKNKFGITPSMIFMNLLLVLIICTVCFFTYNIINGEDGTSSEPPFTAVTSEPPETEAPATDSDVSSAPESTASVEESSGTASDTSTDNQPTIDFDKEYFSSSLFIGDSISTGLSLYGFLDQDNVFAQQGLAPSTALDAEIDGVTLSDKIAAFKPKKIFVMLGTNSVGYADNETLAASMNELVEKISGLTKAKIYVISIPPITPEAEQSDENELTKKDIDDYNAKLKTAVSGSGASFIDLNSVLSNSDGYFDADYAEMDGIHFMGTTYEVMLSYLQKHSS
jgi:lysophospholipase L1-like esterase